MNQMKIKAEHMVIYRHSRDGNYDGSYCKLYVELVQLHYIRSITDYATVERSVGVDERFRENISQ